MPGIAGIFTEPGHCDASQLLEAMLQSMMHEPFHHERPYHIDQERGWFIGDVAMTRALGDSGPTYNRNHSVALLMAGECFGESLRSAGLGTDGNPPKSGDRTHIVHSYEEKGLDFIHALNGLFSGVIVDSNAGRAILFNDRYGLQRMYYHEAAEGFYFASEAKALLGILPSCRAIEPESMAEYLCFDCVLEDRSYFPRINLLSGGTLLIYDHGRVEKHSYYDPKKFESLPPASDPEDYFDRLRDTFQTAVARRISSNDEICIALTGGLDSRFILSCLPREHHRAITYSIGGMYRDSMDLRLAREVSKASQLTHHTVRLDHTFLADYGAHAARAVYMTDGLADVTNVDNVFLNKLARDFASIKVTGAFGSQVLGRVKRALRYRPPNAELLHKDFKPHVSAVSKRLDAWRHEHSLSFCVKREIPWYWSRFITGELSLLMLRLPFLDNDFIDLLFRAPRGGFDGSNFELKAIEKLKPALLNFRTNKGVGGRSPAIVSGVMQKFIMYRALVEKSFTWDVLPHSLHHVAARLDSALLSPLHLDRLILGWEYFRHYNKWFRRELAPYLKEIVLDQQTLKRPYWNAKNLEAMVNDHVRGRRNNLADIRKVVTTELIIRELVDRHWRYPRAF